MIPNPLNVVADLAATVAGRLMRPKTAKPWEPTGWNPWRTLRSIDDYRNCALGASPAVAYVRVRAAANDPKMPEGEVEIRVQGRLGRKASPETIEAVRREVVRCMPVGVALRVISW